MGGGRSHIDDRKKTGISSNFFFLETSVNPIFSFCLNMGGGGGPHFKIIFLVPTVSFFIIRIEISSWFRRLGQYTVPYASYFMNLARPMLYVRYNFSVLLSWICIDLALLDPDPYSYWERGSGSRSKDINVGMFL